MRFLNVGSGLRYCETDFLALFKTGGPDQIPSFAVTATRRESCRESA